MTNKTIKIDDILKCKIMNHAFGVAPLKSSAAYRLDLQMPGVARICGWRKHLRDLKRQAANFREELPYAIVAEKRGGAFDAGFLTEEPSFPSNEKNIAVVRDAIRLGLPAELEELCRQFISQFDGEQ